MKHSCTHIRGWRDYNKELQVAVHYFRGSLTKYINIQLPSDFRYISKHDKFCEDLSSYSWVIMQKWLQCSASDKNLQNNIKYQLTSNLVTRSFAWAGNPSGNSYSSLTTFWKIWYSWLQVHVNGVFKNFNKTTNYWKFITTNVNSHKNLQIHITAIKSTCFFS